MDLLLIFLPYFLVPLGITLLFRRYNTFNRRNTFIVSASVLALYPFCLITILNNLNPPSPNNYYCGIGNSVLVLVNLFFCLPTSVLMQLIFNYLLLNKKSQIQNLKS
jgi:hypothetical protein